MPSRSPQRLARLAPCKRSRAFGWVTVLAAEGERLSNGFQRTLDHIRSIAGSESRKRTPLREADENVLHQGSPLPGKVLPGLAVGRLGCPEAGISMAPIRASISSPRSAKAVTAAIQCKCYAPGTQISKPHLDSFIAASARDPFTARIMVDTGDEWGPNARQDHRSAEAALRRASLRRSREPTVRLARSGPRRTGGADVSARTVQSAPPSEDRTRGT